jgi:ribosomal protein S18 acetylase RimI-like enzyme
MRERDFLSELGSLAVVTRLKRASDAMIHDGRRMYKELGIDIEPNWFAVFKLLKKRGPQSVTQMSDALGLSHPSVISIINKMLKGGYLTESRGDLDNRKRMLTLTPLAEQRFPEFEKVWDAGTAGFKRMMADIDVLQMLDVLEQRLAEKGFRRRTLDELERLGSVQVVSYSDDYKDDFARLNYEWIAKYYTIEKHDHEQLDDPRKSTIDPGGQIFFALVDGKVAGTVAMIKTNDGEFELAKMAVSPEFQGYKLGDKLMIACIDFARDRGAQRIVLESNTRQIAAINLYRKHGFVEIPRDPNSQYVRSNIRMELVL